MSKAWLFLLLGALLVWWLVDRKTKTVTGTVGLAADEGTVGGKRLTYAPSSGDMLSGTPGDQQQLWDFANSLPVE